MAWPYAAGAGGCTPSGLSSFSRLGAVVSQARAGIQGQLLAAWLLRPRNTAECRFVFRIDMLMQDGQVHSMSFDAQTLEPVDIRDDDWVDVDAHGTGADRGEGGQTRISDANASAGDGRADDDKGDDGGDDDGGDDDGGDDDGGDDDGRDDDGRDDDGRDDDGRDDRSGPGGGDEHDEPDNSGPGSDDD